MRSVQPQAIGPRAIGCGMRGYYDGVARFRGLRRGDLRLDGFVILQFNPRYGEWLPIAAFQGDFLPRAGRGEKDHAGGVRLDLRPDVPVDAERRFRWTSLGSGDDGLDAAAVVPLHRVRIQCHSHGVHPAEQIIVHLLNAWFACLEAQGLGLGLECRQGVEVLLAFGELAEFKRLRGGALRFEKAE